jgi:sugar phosphate isomerase/epimerase
MFDMKMGISSYSLYRAMQTKEMDILQVIEWIAEQGGMHIEIVPGLGFSFKENPELIDAVREKAADTGIEISNYAIGANFVSEKERDVENEIQRVMQEVETANRLGVKLMRHDVASRPVNERHIAQFETDLPVLVDACRRIADHATQYGITTSVENHGYYIQASDRVQRLIDQVDRDNFKTTLDVGNFMCVDENSVAAVKNNLSYASIIHLKDFYLRPSYRDPGQGWFRTAGGNFLRGAIVGQGDIDMVEVIRVIKQSGYDGYISIEFEGMEPCTEGTKIGMENAIRIWNEL